MYSYSCIIVVGLVLVVVSRYYIIVLFFSLCGVIKVSAQDSLALFVLTADDLAITNSQNLEEALVNVPGIHHFIKKGNSFTTFGTLSTGQIAIFKNNMPVAMDQNVGFNLRAIPLWDIERIEVHIAAVSNLIKNSSTLVIKMYTIEYKKQSVWGGAHIITNSINDFSTGINLGISNVKHSLQVGANRTFQTPLYGPSIGRSTVWGAEQRLDFNISYRYKILNTMVLDVYSDHTVLSAQNKGDVIPNTSRVRDLNSRFRNHTLSSSLYAPISKNHSIQVSGKLQRFTNVHQLLDKDLHTGEIQENMLVEKKQNTGYDYGYMRLEISSDNKQLNYNAGFELSNTLDNTISNVNAVATEYADYAAFANFQFRQKNNVILKGGSKLLVHSLSGSHFLPYASLVLAPSKVVQLTTSYIRSLSYPLFNSIFYTASMNQGVAGNIQLNPVKQNTISINLKIGTNKLTAQTGLLYLQSNEVMRVSASNTFENSGTSSTTSLYTMMQYQDKIWHIRPFAVLHNNNFVRDSLGISYVHPQLGLAAKAIFPKTKTMLGVTWKIEGTNTSLDRRRDIIYQEDIGRIRRLSFYVKQPFFQDKLHLSFGVNNHNNDSLIERNTYMLGLIDRELLESDTVLTARNRAFTVSVKYLL